MRTFLTAAALLVLVSEPIWAQSYFQFGSPPARQYYLPPTYPYFTPPPRANRRTQGGRRPSASAGKRGDSRAVCQRLDRDRQSRAQFVFCRRDRAGNPVSGSDRQACGPMGGRANNHGEARKSHLVSAGGQSNGNPTFHPLSRQGLKIRSGLGRYTWAKRFAEFTEPTGPARSAAPSRMAVFACTTRTSSSCMEKCKSERRSTSCLD
jgi:hypothetical protein